MDYLLGTSNKIYSTYSSQICFKETSVNDSLAEHIDEILADWKGIHNNTQHGLTQCYNVNKLNINEEIDIPIVLVVLPIVLEKEKEIFLSIIVYHMSGPLSFFINYFID